MVTSIEQKGSSGRKLVLIKNYKALLESEIVSICNDIHSIIQDVLIPNSSSLESKVFYYKMKADYHRYLAEFQLNDERKASAGEALEAYEAASALASAAADLRPTNPLRLGLALNLSVLYYEILARPDRACHIAKQAFDEAVAELDTNLLGEESYKESTDVLQLLRDNVILWTGGGGEEHRGGVARGEGR